MNLEQIKRDHVANYNPRGERPLCQACRQEWPCDALRAVARVEELEAALRDCIVALPSDWQNDATTLRAKAVLTSVIDRVAEVIVEALHPDCPYSAEEVARRALAAASLPVREETEA